MGITSDALAALAAPFEPKAVHWRAQTITERDGRYSALALAYLDARDVMDRLDSVCGPENWQDRFEETAKGRVICTLSLNVDGYWVNKSDGAGDTDIEGDKGGLSDALKRTAVKWGIGRYLYRLGNTWAECEVAMRGGEPVKNNKGNFIFRKWTPAGEAALSTALNSLGTTYINDDQRDLIAMLSQSAGVTLQTICDGYEIADLRQLPASRFPALKKRLQAPREQKEAA